MTILQQPDGLVRATTGARIAVAIDGDGLVAIGHLTAEGNQFFTRLPPDAARHLAAVLRTVADAASPAGEGSR